MSKRSSLSQVYNRIYRRVYYRSKQFFTALINTQKPVNDLSLVNLIFAKNTKALALFKQMSASDQHHALAVWHTLQTWGEDHIALQQAALLHDVGKSLGQPLLHRVFIVLLKAFWPTALKWLAEAPLNCSAWRRPFVIHQQHPAIGAKWAAEVGCDVLVVSLIETHQHKPDVTATNLRAYLHKKLYEADNLN